MKKIADYYEITAAKYDGDYMATALYAIHLGDTDIVVGTGKLNDETVTVVYSQPSVYALTSVQKSQIATTYCTCHGEFPHAIDEMMVYLHCNDSKLIYTSHPEFVPEGYKYEGIPKEREYKMTVSMVLKAFTEDEAVAKAYQLVNQENATATVEHIEQIIQ